MAPDRDFKMNKIAARRHIIPYVIVIPNAVRNLSRNTKESD